MGLVVGPTSIALSNQSVWTIYCKCLPSIPRRKRPWPHAYTTVYGSYHGWAVQKIFNYSFQAAPQVTEIYKYMNPTLLEQVTDKARLQIGGTRHQDESSPFDDSSDYQQQQGQGKQSVGTIDPSRGWRIGKVCQIILVENGISWWTMSFVSWIKMPPIPKTRPGCHSCSWWFCYIG